MSGEISMSTVTFRLPDDICLRLQQLASSRGISLNKLLEELCLVAIAAHDAEVRFGALAVLDRLDALDRAGI